MREFVYQNYLLSSGDKVGSMLGVGIVRSICGETLRLDVFTCEPLRRFPIYVFDLLVFHSVLVDDYQIDLHDWPHFGGRFVHYCSADNPCDLGKPVDVIRYFFQNEVDEYLFDANLACHKMRYSSISVSIVNSSFVVNVE